MIEHQRMHGDNLGVARKQSSLENLSQVVAMVALRPLSF